MQTVETRSFTGTESLPEFLKTCTEPTDVTDIRRAAHAKFTELPWPSQRDEEWRRTDVSSLDFDAYSFGRSVPSAPADGELNDNESGRIVFENAGCSSFAVKKDLSDQGVVFLPIDRLYELFDANHSESLARARKAFLEALSGTADALEDRIAALHYSAFTHGVFLYVPPGLEITDPFIVELNVSGDHVMCAPQIVAVAEKSSRAVLIERIVGADEGDVLYNEGIALSLGDNASLGFFQIQNLNIDSSVFSTGRARIARDARLHHFTGHFGGMLAKTRFDAILDGPGSDVQLSGLYIGSEDQHMDLRTVQVHNSSNAESRTYYKGAVRDEAHTVFQGLIRVEDHAAKTDAFLENKNLLLNDGARSDSIPSLQINTNDVRCSHGSTTAKIDQNQVHYLRTRGFSRTEAERTLIQGYFEDVIDRTPEPMRDELRELVVERID